MTYLNLHELVVGEIALPLKAPFVTSFGTSLKRRILIIRITDREGATGYGECTAPEEPFFNHETIDTAWTIISDFVVPLLAENSIAEAAEVSGALSPIRGNRMAIGGVESAIWDLEAKRAQTPLWKHLRGTQKQINCGVSI